jgi:hypothetical protein
VLQAEARATKPATGYDFLSTDESAMPLAPAAKF